MNNTLNTSSSGSNTNRHKTTVLLVDDQAIIGEAVKRMLAEEDNIVFHFCQDSSKAIATANEIFPTLILQDLVMPEINGLTLVKYFRANPTTKDVPLIVLSSKEEPKIKAQAFSLGANDYMIKLPDKLELLARIRYHSSGYINMLERNEAFEAILETQKALSESENRYRELFEHMSSGVMVLQYDNEIEDFILIHCNNAVEKMETISKEKAIGNPLCKEIPWICGAELFDAMVNVWKSNEAISLTTSCKNGGTSSCHESYVYRLNTTEIVLIYDDISERMNAEKEKKHILEKLQQSEKMASVGQLAAGVAHEINNPISFVKSNFKTLISYVSEIKSLLAKYSELEISAREGKIDRDLLNAIELIYSEKEIEYILEDLDQLLEESLDGAERVRVIVQDLKTFAHTDEYELKEIDINECLKATLKIVWSQIKYNCEIETNFHAHLPLVECYPSQINQVFMNLITNAGQAIEKQGTITLETQPVENNESVEIRISDTGGGIPEEVISRIFEPFFTTKDIGSGTGLGLSIVHGIIDKHGGTIELESEVGKGTLFTITLPCIAKT